ncbi:MAG: archease [Dehalococcoidia bacterium]|nr:archease [Dehalococcoidia bacterium]
MKRFDILEHTADTGIIAYGRDLPEAFANAAYGMFSLMADLRQVREETSRYVEAEAGDTEGLVVSWLNELLYIFDVERIIFKRFDILEFTGTRLRADAYGEKADPSRHRLKGGVKAATYHMLKVMERRDGCSIQVIFDV